MAPEFNRLTVPATVASLRLATEFVRRAAAHGGMAESELGKIELALEEIFVNVALYAYPTGEKGSIEVACAVPGPGRLIVEITDSGREFNPLASGPPDLSAGLDGRAVGGLGIFLVKSLAASAAYRRENGHNLLSLCFQAGESI